MLDSQFQVKIWRAAPPPLLPSLARYGSIFLPRPKRHFQAFCVGAPRSGTHSLAFMFARHYRSAHQADFEKTNTLIRDWLEGNISQSVIKQILRTRDRILGLELESSHALHYWVPLLAELFEDAKFILPIRDPYGWLKSEINKTSMTKSPYWKMLHPYRYSCYGFEFQPPERPLEQQHRFYPLASYLSYWGDHNRYVIDSVPAERLLVIRTDRIAKDVPKLAAFLGIAPDSIDTSRAHSGQAAKKQIDVLSLVDRGYIESQVHHYCQDLMSEFFPDILKLS